MSLLEATTLNVSADKSNLKVLIYSDESEMIFCFFLRDLEFTYCHPVLLFHVFTIDCVYGEGQC